MDGTRETVVLGSSMTGRVRWSRPFFFNHRPGFTRTTPSPSKLAVSSESDSADIASGAEMESDCIVLMSTYVEANGHHVQPERSEGRVSRNQGHLSEVLESRGTWLVLQAILRTSVLKYFGLQPDMFGSSNMMLSGLIIVTRNRFA